MEKMERLWEKIYRQDGSLLYEGYTINGKANGPGATYYVNGNPLHEGIFGVKGLLFGREYYSNGQVRFEGVFKINKAYGPNEPEYGTWYDENGKTHFHGKFAVSHGGVGFPSVKTPEDYGTAYIPDDLNEHLLMWTDE